MADYDYARLADRAVRKMLEDRFRLPRTDFEKFTVTVTKISGMKVPTFYIRVEAPEEFSYDLAQLFFIVKFYLDDTETPCASVDCFEFEMTDSCGYLIKELNEASA